MLTKFSLYIPALARQGRNEILIFEEMALTEQNLQIDFTDHLITEFIPLTPEINDVRSRTNEKVASQLRQLLLPPHQ